MDKGHDGGEEPIKSGLKPKGFRDCDPIHEAAILDDLAVYHDERATAEAKALDRALVAKSENEARISERREKLADHLRAAKACREKAAWWLQLRSQAPHR